jgi:hypothetical protein
MQYPAIVYQRDATRSEFAGNKPYSSVRRWQVTVIDRDPDSETVARVTQLPMCTHDRYFAADGLNHDVFTIYF